MKKYLFLSTLIFVLALSATSCGDDEDVVDVDCTTVTYSGTIKALVDSNCSDSNCHGTGAANGDFTSYEKIKDVATDGKMRTQVVEDKSMPLGGKLTGEQIAQVKCWLDDGAPDN